MSTLKLILYIVSLIILVLFTAFFSSSETAFLSLDKIKIRRMLVEKKPRARLVSRLKTDMDTLLTSVLIGTNFVNSLASALATLLAFELVGQGAVAVASLVISFFITVFGQIVPKTIAGRYPEKTASFSSTILFVFKKVFFPLIWFFSKIAQLAVSFVSLIIPPDDGSVTQEEIQTLFDVGSKEGTIEKNESVMLNKIFSMDDLHVKDIMTHRSFTCMVGKNASRTQVINTFLGSGFSSIVVFDEDVDDVLGIINYKSILFMPSEEEKYESDYPLQVMDKPLFVPQSFSVFELLQKFRQTKNDIAIVLDEQGGFAGLVTIKDVMAVVFGRMIDESNNEMIPPENRIKVLSSSELLVPGDMKLADLNSLLNTNLESEEFLTFGGWLLEQFGHLPSGGEILIYQKRLFTVEDVQNRRIVSVRVKLK